MHTSGGHYGLTVEEKIEERVDIGTSHFDNGCWLIVRDGE